jgi:hypothetical protein
MREFSLLGGAVSDVVRIGDTVHRRAGTRCWRGIQAGADAGDPAMVRLRDQGAVRNVRADWGWVGRHRGELEGR